MNSNEELIARARSTITDPNMAVYDEEFQCIFLYSNGFNQTPDCVWDYDEWMTLQEADMYWIVDDSLRRRGNDRIDGSNKVRKGA